ncbi:family 2 glycosyl transferase [Candidatus Woesearchaeota archaeon]|jgi:glycosyltransferase involved in cell wall biosynthesis|nr:family 2 glycosyl transferase [Candidatus Woesearchaeota archaeon]|tara:strand:- start:944 stop:1609 length:666 start_codon:yes stop_codon:yes gene_type:complete
MVWVVIAAFNEAATIGNVVKDLADHGYKNIIVVDDGSEDATAKAAQEAGAVTLKHNINRGQGASLQTGIEYAVTKNPDVIVTFDADGQHRPEDIQAVVKPVKEGKAKIAFGSRFLGKSNVPLHRKLLLKGGIALVWLFYGVKMTDAHNGLRAFSPEAAETLNLHSDRMGHASEIIEWVRKEKIPYVEVPVVIKYHTTRQGHGSYIQAVRVFFDMVWRKLSQ